MNFGLLLLVYFIYGLAFFSLGLILLLEAGRTPALEQRRLLFPLSIFGLLHGLHEWIEIFILQSEELGGTLPSSVTWFRLGLLALSFLALWIYGWLAFQAARQHFSPLTFFGLISLPIFMLLILLDVVLAFQHGAITPLQMTGALIRYLLAVPGAALASLGLQAGASRARSERQIPLNLHLAWTSFGFALYSASQLFVSKMNSILAGSLNAEAFTQQTGIPVQALRTAAAILITWNMFRATQFVEDERRAQLAAAQKARLEALEQQEAMRRDLLRHTVRAQEEERARIARELHDEMAQTLTAFSLDLGTLRNVVGPHARALPLLNRLQELGRQMSQGMHRMVHDLRPSHLDDLGLLAALKVLTENDGPRLGLQIEFNTEGPPRRIDSLSETVLYRVAQEAITNTARHAKTKRVFMNLAYSTQDVQLRVMDEGIGFDPQEKFTAPRGWGLAGMRERAESLGGRFEVQAEAGRGTIIRVTVPIRNGKVE